MQSYTKKQVVKITGLKPYDVQFYTEQGVVPPFVSEGQGRGTFRRWSPSDLVKFLIIKGLKSYGVTIHVIKNIIEEAFDEFPGGERLISGYLKNWYHERKFAYYLVIYRDDDGDELIYYITRCSKEGCVIDGILMENRASALIIKLNPIFDLICNLEPEPKIKNNIEGTLAKSQKEFKKSGKKTRSKK